MHAVYKAHIYSVYTSTAVDALDNTWTPVFSVKSRCLRFLPYERLWQDSDRIWE